MPRWLLDRLTSSDDWRLVWDFEADVGAYCDTTTGEVFAWRYRTPKEGGSVPEWDCYRAGDNPRGVTMIENRLPQDKEIRAIAWWNSMSKEHRRTMLESPNVRDNPTPARCWEVFGKDSKAR